MLGAGSRVRTARHTNAMALQVADPEAWRLSARDRLGDPSGPDAVKTHHQPQISSRRSSIQIERATRPPRPSREQASVDLASPRGSRAAGMVRFCIHVPLPDADGLPGRAAVQGNAGRRGASIEVVQPKRGAKRES